MFAILAGFSELQEFCARGCVGFNKNDEEGGSGRPGSGASRSPGPGWWTSSSTSSPTEMVNQKPLLSSDSDIDELFEIFWFCTLPLLSLLNLHLLDYMILFSFLGTADEY
jgi:hypothetical protein